MEENIKKKTNDLSDFTFGQLLSHLLTVSHLKSYILANHLNYDVSYISKWVTGSMLPAAKHIHNLSKEIARIIVEGSDEASLNNLYETYSVGDIDSLIDAINQSLLLAYQRSTEKKGRSKSILLSEENNSHMVANPHLQQQYMRFNTAFIDKEKTFKMDKKAGMVMMIDLFALSKEDKLHIAEINTDANFSEYVKEVHYLLSLNHELIDDEFDALLITYLLNNAVKFDFTLSHYKNALCSLMFVIQNYCMHLSIMIQNHRTIFSDTSYDKKVISEMYDTLISVEESFAKPLVSSSKMDDIIIEKQYLSFILSSHIDLFVSKMDEFLLPDDVFEELLEKSGVSNQKENEIRTLHNLFKNAVGSSNIRIAILDEELQNYALNGHINFYGMDLTTTFEQREKHLHHIMTLLNNKTDKGQICIANHSYLKDFDQDFSPCIYLSSLFSYIRITSGTESDCVYLIESDDLKEIYIRFVNHIFEEAQSDKFSKEMLSNSLNMIRLLKS